MGGSPGDVGEVPMTEVKQRKGCRMSFDVDKAHAIMMVFCISKMIL